MSEGGGSIASIAGPQGGTTGGPRSGPQQPNEPSALSEANEPSTLTGDLERSGSARQGAPVTGVERHGMFHANGSGDTSGYGLLVREPFRPEPAQRPFGGSNGDRSAAGEFDLVADTLAAAMAAGGVPAGAITQITVANREITFYADRTHLSALLWILRDDPGLRFELASSIAGVDYGPGVPRRLHVVYELTSMTYRRRIRVEVAVDVDDPHVPSAVAVYPTADWHEREAWDMFGIIFDGHPGLTRILMPDDWEGHPQRKDYPLGGIPVEYQGAEIAAPDERRRYS